MKLINNVIACTILLLCIPANASIRIQNVGTHSAFTIPSVLLSTPNTLSQTQKTEALHVPTNISTSSHTDYKKLTYSFKTDVPRKIQLSLKDATGKEWQQPQATRITPSTNSIDIPLTNTFPDKISEIILTSELDAIPTQATQLTLTSLILYDDPLLSAQNITISSVGTISSFTIDGKTILDNDFIKNTPEITLRTTSSNLSGYTIRIINTATQEIAAEKSEILTTPQDTAVFTITSALPEGKYQIFATANFGSEIATINSKIALVQSSFELTDALNSPNPFNPNTQSTAITYSLSKNADVDLYIYTINGELQEKTHINAGEPGGTAGYNSTLWDGKNQFNETVSNGIYIAYIIAKSEGKVKKGKVKIWARK